MRVMFCGHKEFENEALIKEMLTENVGALICQGASEFYLGGYGKFDYIAAQTIKGLKQHYTHIQSILVLPYLNRTYNPDLYDASVYPPLESIPKKYAILKRNQWMVDMSDVVIAYVKYDFGGAAKTLEYAQKRKKSIIEIQI